MKKFGQCLLLTSALMVLVMLAVSPVVATTVDLTSYITNSSFEFPAVGITQVGTPVTGWTSSGIARVWYPPAAHAAYDFNQVAALGKAGNGTLSQVLTGVTLQAGSTYTLSAEVRKTYSTNNQEYQMVLYAVDKSLGDVLLAQASGPPTSQWTWEGISTNYTANNSALYGDDLKIVLSGINTNTVSNAEIDFDKIQLTASSVPIPATMLLFGTGLLGLVGLRRFKKA